mmetsp:Transcript_27309/g.40655  ORF Transcript_27309/g.40655 Transcript_27309/m.40655 type:complete len:138 (+) Transcript_27309:468-881(+)
MPPICNYQHRPTLRTLQDVPYHPSVGRGFNYETHFRRAVMEADDQGQRRNPVLNALRTVRLWPSERTIRRWRRRRVTEGHFVPYRRCYFLIASLMLLAISLMPLSISLQLIGNSRQYIGNLTGMYCLISFTLISGTK